MAQDTGPEPLKTLTGADPDVLFKSSSIWGSSDLVGPLDFTLEIHYIRRVIMAKRNTHKKVSMVPIIGLVKVEKIHQTPEFLEKTFGIREGLVLDATYNSKNSKRGDAAKREGSVTVIAPSGHAICLYKGEFSKLGWR